MFWMEKSVLGLALKGSAQETTLHPKHDPKSQKTSPSNHYLAPCLKKLVKIGKILTSTSGVSFKPIKRCEKNGPIYFRAQLR